MRTPPSAPAARRTVRRPERVSKYRASLVLPTSETECGCRRGRVLVGLVVPGGVAAGAAAAEGRGPGRHVCDDRAWQGAHVPSFPASHCAAPR
jgi:hypothetical protein